MPNFLAQPQFFAAALLYLLSHTSLTQAQSPAPVAVTTPQAQAASQTVQLSGTVRALQTSNVSSRVDGAVAAVLVEDGSRVNAGDTLLQLDDQLEQIELTRLQAVSEQAQAQAKEAQRRVTEALRLSKEKHIAATELAERQASLATARANLKEAQAAVAAQQQRLQYHQITAPYSGVITRKLSEQGEWLTQGTAVAELVAMDATYLDVEIPQTAFYQLTADTKVEIQPDTNKTSRLPASIATSIPVANETSRTFRLRLIAEDPHHTLLPGSSATATFRTAQASTDMLTLPKDALLRNPDNSFAVFVVNNQSEPAKAERRAIKVGQALGERIEVLSGISADSQVVIRGNEILRHDQPVTIVN